MTVIQFRPRQQAQAQAQPRRTSSSDPTLYMRAWLCVAIGLYISPWIRWLEILSEPVHDDGGHEAR
jgi:hypothetical protein